MNTFILEQMSLKKKGILIEITCNAFKIIILINQYGTIPKLNYLKTILCFY